MKAIAGALGLMLITACGSEPLRIVNETVYSESFARTMIATSLTGLTDDARLLDGYTFNMRDAIGKACPDGTVACTNIEAQSISVPFTSDWSPGVKTMVTCHEIVHAYLAASGEVPDGDPSHKRADLFYGYCGTFNGGSL